MLTQEQARELTVRLHRRMNNEDNYRNQELGIMIPKNIGKEIVYLNIDLYNILSES